MAAHSPYSVVSYSEDTRVFLVHAIEPAAIAPLLAGKLELPIAPEEFDNKLDDEFARRLSVAMLNLIALGQP
ncbi:hypothetical protein [Caballeronia concitans]|uniref:Uncharacterized protein n=1 Tax=Caballeronia concitans TaxID=1777133 RepID=A0A658QV22_9BURK|nr:hypothetical protein [Caballeronia concitans]KIG09304.1 hypothetical protein BurMR1_3128 [Burkholderia sp. MR1]SAL24547.1 hypothetical protein AWB72_01891 [Caballeronia concitans]